jgi:hypothetical protein
MLAGITNPEGTDAELIAWLTGLLSAIFPPPAPPAPVVE